jgi:hypothetical protein
LQSPYYYFDFNSASLLYCYFYLDSCYDLLLDYNSQYLLYRNNKQIITYNISYFFWYLKLFIKINITLFIIYSIFFYSNLDNYIKQIINLNILTKLFILNENEKEVGSTDDFFFFAILFFSTILIFVVMSIILLILQNKILLWLLSVLILIAVLILTIPFNLFLDFGAAFFVYIRGSATSTNVFKELLFDLIATATIIIRFVVQNIRFMFIFGAIFELFEWLLNISSVTFFKIFYTSNNLIYNYFDNNSNINILIINSILIFILYFYYSLHLIFLLFSQIIIFILISIWLFFFLYTTFFLNKTEKFFLYKKYNL